MPVTNFYTVNGRIIGYNDGGGRKDFLTDALGSVTAEVDQTGPTKTFDGRYKPYGADLSIVGTRGSFGWVGIWGYRATGLSSSSHYVRARHYSKTSGNWTTSDPLWPNQLMYGYVNTMVTSRVDPFGLGQVEVDNDYFFKMIGDWWSGRDATDPNGNPVRIGGWPAVLNRCGNALTINGTIHVDDEDVFNNFCAPGPKGQEWRDHEEAHIDQGFSTGDIPSYAGCQCVSWAREVLGCVPKSEHGGTGHDVNFWERDAEVRRKQGIGTWEPDPIPKRYPPLPPMPKEDPDPSPWDHFPGEHSGGKVY